MRCCIGNWLIYEIQGTWDEIKTGCNTVIDWLVSFFIWMVGKT